MLSLGEKRSGTRLENTSPSAGVFLQPSQGIYSLTAEFWLNMFININTIVL